MRAILYIRVSTDEQADKGYSQRNQDEVLHKYCALKSIVVQDVIYEDHSAKTFNRPEWIKMLGTLKKVKEKHSIDLILFTKWDRFSRNTADAYQMIGILRKLGIEPQAIEQPLDLSVPENKMMLAFYLAVPEVENDRRALNIFHGMRRAKKEGRWVATAPLGYINRSTEDGRKYIRPDEPQADILRFAFNEIATGKYATDQVWKMARQKGLRCGRKQFWNVVRNPAYCGKITVQPFKDEPLQLVVGQHEPIITEELFCKVQDVLDGRKIKRGAKIVSLSMLPLRGFLICPRCGRLLTGSASKGRNAFYYYYHCSKGCTTRFKTDMVNAAFDRLLKSLKPRRSYLLVFKEIARDVFKQQTLSKQNQRLQVLSKIETLQSRLKKARELLLSDAIDAYDFGQIKTDCETQIRSLTMALSDLPDLAEAITQLLNRYAKRFLDLHDIYNNAALEDKRKLVSLLLAPNIVYHDIGFDQKQLSNVLSIIYQSTC
jgi:site-specific DNA recombinase